MNCTSCGGTIEVGNPAAASPAPPAGGGGGRCSTCHRLFSIEGTNATRLQIEPPRGAPPTEFRESFAAHMGLPPAPVPPKGMRNFEFLTMNDDATALATRSQRTSEHGAHTFDMVRAAYACPRCNQPTPAPAPLIPTRAPYRSIADVANGLPALVEAGARAGRAVPPCSTCGSPPVLAQADHHLFHSRSGADVVVRVASGAAPLVLGWSITGGYTQLAASPELDRQVAGDAIARTAWALRESFDEDEDMESMAAVIVEGVTQSPETRGLLDLCPFLMKHDGDQVVETLADAHIKAAPQSELGYYWKAQILIERAAKQGGDPRLSAEAQQLLDRAVQIKPDYPDALIGLANLARLARDDAAAETRLRALIAAHPDHPEGNYTLGLVLLAKDPAGALACFERGEKASPRDPDYPRCRARALLALGRKQEARAAIEHAASLAPDDPRVRQVAAEIGAGGGSNIVSWVIRGIVVAILAAVAWFVYGTVKKALPPSTPHTAPAEPPKHHGKPGH